MKHVMLDLETLGTRPGCVVLSVGAVFFDANLGLGAEFYSVVKRSHQVELGLHEDPDTMKWWARQSEEAKRAVMAADEPDAPTVHEALAAFQRFIKLDTNVKVWGNGADFDNPILAHVHHSVELKQAWNTYNGRCYRTLKNIAPGPKIERVGTYHNALDDAKGQALHAIQLFKLHPTLEMA